MSHNLHIRIDDHPFDGRLLSVTDASDYDSLLEVTNRTLIAQGPGFDIPLELITQQSGTLHYSSKDFGYTSRKNRTVLPDGLYSFTYSVAPNNKVYTVVHHFRTYALESMMYGQIALRLLSDKNEVNFSGGFSINEQDPALVRALYLVNSLKAPISDDASLQRANRIYNEAVTILQTLGIKQIEYV